MLALPPHQKATKELYANLFLPDNASYDEVRKAWRKIAAKHHPDQNNGVENEIFKKARIAHDILTAPVMKEWYDKYGVTPKGMLNLDKHANTLIAQALTQILDNLTSPDMPIVQLLRKALYEEKQKKSLDLAGLEKANNKLLKTKENVEQYWKGAEIAKAVTLGILNNKVIASNHVLQQTTLELSITTRAVELVSDANYELPKPPEEKPQYYNPGSGNSWVITFG